MSFGSSPPRLLGNLPEACPIAQNKLYLKWYEVSRKKFGKTFSRPIFPFKKMKSVQNKPLSDGEFFLLIKKSTQILCALFRSLLVLVIHLVLEIRVSVVRVISLIALVAVRAVRVLVVRLVRPRVVAIAILIVLHYKLPPF